MYQTSTMKIFHSRVAVHALSVSPWSITARVHFISTVVIVFHQTHKVERENRKLLMMWNTTRARLLEAEQANFSSEGGTFSLVTADPSKDTKGKEAEERGTRRRSRKRARRSTRKGGPLVEAGTGHGAEVLSLANNKPADGVAQG